MLTFENFGVGTEAAECVALRVVAASSGMGGGADTGLAVELLLAMRSS